MKRSLSSLPTLECAPEKKMTILKMTIIKVWERLCADNEASGGRHDISNQVEIDVAKSKIPFNVFPDYSCCSIGDYVAVGSRGVSVQRIL